MPHSIVVLACLVLVASCADADAGAHAQMDADSSTDADAPMDTGDSADAGSEADADAPMDAGTDTSTDTETSTDADADAGPANDPESEGFYLHPNGVTVLCPGVAVGASGQIDGVTYTKQDRAGLDDLLEADPLGLTFVCTSGVTDMNQLFRGASSFNGSIGSWDTSSVTNMSFMFYGASSFNQDIGSWDVSSVSTMQGMFYDASSFNGSLFSWCVPLLDAAPADFDTGADAWTLSRPRWGSACPPNDPERDGFYLAENGVTALCPELAVGASGQIDGVTYTKQDRAGLDGLLRSDPAALPFACTSGVTDMTALFYEAAAFNEPIGSWDMGSVTDTPQMFYYASSFNQDIGAWDTSSVRTMQGMFWGAGSFNQDIGGWDVSNVNNMQGMFQFASSFNQDLSGWCVSWIRSTPAAFGSWPLPGPVWGTCP